MPRSSGEECPAAGVDMIDLDDYMKSPVFQLANQQRACVIDVGSCDNRLPIESISPSDFKSQCHRNLEHYSYGKSPSPARRCAGDRKVPSSDYNAPYNRKRENFRSSGESESSYTCQESGVFKSNKHEYSLDSGVSDGGRCRRHRRSGFHSNVDFYETRRRKDLERSGHKLRTRRDLEHGSPHRSGTHILDTLKLQSEKIDRLAALYEEVLQPRCQPDRPKQPKQCSSSELSSSVVTRDEASGGGGGGGGRLAEQEKCKKMDGKVKTYKIIMRKLDELNRHMIINASGTRQRLRASRSKTSSESVSVSDKAVCTDIPAAKTHKPKTASARTEARAKIVKCDENTSTNSSEETLLKPRRRRKSKADSPERLESAKNDHRKLCSAERLERTKKDYQRWLSAERLETAKLDYRKLCSADRFERSTNYRSSSLNNMESKRCQKVYTAFAKSGFEPPSRRRSRTSEYNLFGINDYNLNDPISFYNRAKHQARHKNHPKPQATNLCTLCNGYWSKLRENGLDLCKHLLCCSDPVSARSGLLQDRRA